MDKYEILEETRREVLTLVEQMPSIPQGVEKAIKDAFKNLAMFYEESRCSFSSVIDYLEGNLNQILKADLKKIGDKRLDEKLGGVQNVFYSLRRKMENEDELTKDDEQKIDIQTGVTKQEYLINMALEESLKDVQSHTNRMLASRGYTDNQIEKIYDEANYIIRRALISSEDKVTDALREDDKALTYLIREKYIKMIRKIPQQPKSKSEEFRSSLDATDTFGQEEQKQFAEDFAKKNKEENDSPAYKSPFDLGIDEII